MPESIEHGERDYHEETIFHEMMDFEQESNLPPSDQFPVFHTENENEELK